MHKGLWVLCGLALAAAPAYSADPGCMKSRELVLKAATQHDCPGEEAEAKAINCEGTAIKDAKRLYELIKSCDAKPRKGASSSMAAPRTEKPAASAPAAAGETALPPGKFKYRAVAADGKVLAMAGSDKSGADALGGTKDLVKKSMCDGKVDKIDFTAQSYKEDGSWTKGIASSVTCRK